MIESEDVNEGDVLEARFHSIAMNMNVSVGLDVTSAHTDLIRGEVLVVENMPFDALESEELDLDIDDDEVRVRDSMYGTVIGGDIELISV